MGANILKEIFRAQCGLRLFLRFPLQRQLRILVVFGTESWIGKLKMFADKEVVEDMVYCRT